MAKLYSEEYDQSIDRHRKVYSLDNERLCYLTEFSTQGGRVDLYSIDLEYARDSHYQIDSAEIAKLAASFGVAADTESLADALTVYFAENFPYNIEDHLKKHDVRFQQFHFY